MRSIERFPTAAPKISSTPKYSVISEIAEETSGLLLSIADPFDTFKELFGVGGGSHALKKRSPRRNAQSPYGIAA